MEGRNDCNAYIVQRVLSLIFLAMFVLQAGCRTAWQPKSSSEPSFDRLIEIEQKSRTPSSPIHGLSSRLRPGAAGRVAEPPLGGAEVEAGGKSDADLEDFSSALAAVPAAQRQLLQREAETLRASRAQKPEDSPIENIVQSGPSEEEPIDIRRSGRNDLAASATQTGVSYSLSDAADDAEVELEGGQASSSSNQNALTAKPIAFGQSNPTPPSRSPAETFAPADSELARSTQVSSASATQSAIGVDPSAAAVTVAHHAAGASNPVALAGGVSTSDRGGHPDPAMDWREHLYQASELLTKSAESANPEEKKQQEMALRLLHLALGNIDAASKPLDGLEEHGQEFVRHSLKALHDIADPDGNPIESKRYTLAMISQRQAMKHLAAVSNLEVSNAAFCTEVESFGVVTKFPRSTFRADEEVLLYCELDNFVSEFNEGKGYETQLQGSYEIVDAGGRRVADQLLPLDSNVCRNQRRDYFIAYRVYMPAAIAPGNYELRLIIEDLKGRKFGQSSLGFQIAN
jgi:hypothetical protein